MTVMKEEVYTHRSLERGGPACHTGPCGEAPESVRRRRSQGKMWAAVFIVVFVRKASQGNVNKFRIG